MRARVALGAAVLLALGAVVAWWLAHRGAARTARLDPARARADLASHLEHAKMIVATRLEARPAPPFPAPSAKWPIQGTGPLAHAGHRLFDPQCILGPRALCDTIAALIDDCDAGDARDCLAVGQLLADEPPRAWMAVQFFAQACRIGDAEGCERYYRLMAPLDEPCERDVFGCSWRAYRAKDPARMAEACELGVADACVYLAEISDPGNARVTLARACQLGSPQACHELAERLAPDCAPTAERTCFAPDAAEAAAAREMACAAGWGAGCAPGP